MPSILHRSSLTKDAKKREELRSEGGACWRSLLVLQFDFKNEVEGKVCGADKMAARAFHASTCQQAARKQEVGAKLPR